MCHIERKIRGEDKISFDRDLVIEAEYKRTGSNSHLVTSATILYRMNVNRFNKLDDPSEKLECLKNAKAYERALQIFVNTGTMQSVSHYPAST